MTADELMVVVGLGCVAVLCVGLLVALGQPQSAADLLGLAR